MDVLERVLRVRMGRSNGRRAPHKPLLLLYALAHFQRLGGAAPIGYSAAEAELQALISEFAAPGAGGPHYPFHHLSTDDGVWIVRTVDGGGSPGPSPVKLRDSGASGRLGPELAAELLDRPEALSTLAQAILDDNFAPSLHDDICRMAGLDLDTARLAAVVSRSGRRRDPRFRQQVLTAYRHTCAFCGFAGRFGAAASVGLDAAHVRWWAFDGPDDLDNGLCLCALHHKLFDKGVLGLTARLQVVVSPAFAGNASAAHTQVGALHGRLLLTPTGTAGVHADHVSWHEQQVFRAA
ncbi:phosphorothioated DNA-binding restriction endonuclease [Nocardiopsis ansamitocini]|uniref:phosphorothioated DNA-binding restriction endonuclease n=1 Tax=Nocardiopsis ansamitocini TaxID=1670832 RepID=UPI002556444A|nr:HNH endonuclease [Nocardiopsis ansamitocini]